LANKDVTTCLLGFSKLEQIDENLQALDVYKKWGKEIEERIEGILKTAPEGDMNWKEFCPSIKRRTIGVLHKVDGAPN